MKSRLKCLGLFAALLATACAPAKQVVVAKETVTPPPVELVRVAPRQPGPLDGATVLALGFRGPAFSPSLCGALPNGLVRCLSNGEVTDVAFDQPVRQLLIAGSTCAVLETAVACNDRGSTTIFKEVGRRDVIATTVNHANAICGLTEDGQERCARIDGVTTPSPFALAPETRIRTQNTRCAITMAGALKCISPELDAFQKEIGSWQALAIANYPREVRGRQAYLTWAVGLGLDRRVHSIGPGFLGELGNGTRGPSGVVRLDTLGDVDEVVASETHACLRKGGRVACWGESTSGQIPASARVSLPTCAVDSAASLNAYRTGLKAARIGFERCMAQGRLCRQPQTDCTLGCRPPEAESKTVPPTAFVYVQTPEGCLEQPTPSTRTIEPSPVFFPGLEDARQVVVAGGLTCVLRVSGATSCFGQLPGARIEGDGTPR